MSGKALYTRDGTIPESELAPFSRWPEWESELNQLLNFQPELESIDSSSKRQQLIILTSLSRSGIIGPMVNTLISLNGILIPESESTPHGIGI